MASNGDDGGKPDDDNAQTVRGSSGGVPFVEVNLPPGYRGSGAEDAGATMINPMLAGLAMADGGTLGGGRGSTLPPMRRYRDGRLTTATGAPPTPGVLTDSFLELPYASTDVLMRVGPYDVIGQIGQGGMGVVYKAYSIRLGRMCALKAMKPGEDVSAIEIVRFQNEAMLAARLSHPNIVPVFDAGEAGDIFYFVMEYVEGSSFSDLIERGDDESLAVGLRALAKVADALQLAHDHGIVHRDVKPDNILLTAEGEPRITDFGIASSSTDLAEVKHHGIVGTPYYMPPEQANNEPGAMGPLSDVYSLGATMYHLLTGRVPFEGRNVMSVLLAVTRSEPESPTALAASRLKRRLSPDLETICLKAMEKEAGCRYPSARAFADDLRAHLEDRPISARPIGASERFQKLLRRNRAVFAGAVILLSVLMLMTVAFGTVLVFNIHQTSESLRDLDRGAALNQAFTLERAIRVNMLQGRADLARQLVSKLREDPNLNKLLVVRTDQTIAYTDLSTKRAVEKRLGDDKVFDWIKATHPELVPSVEEVRSKAFRNIMDNEHPDELGFDYDLTLWLKLLKEKEPVTVQTEVNGEPVLMVLKPIENSEKCQVCHGEVGEGVYGDDNAIRAVLVVYRSQREVESRIRENQLATAGVGLGTTGLFVALLLLFARLFGIGFRPRQFGLK